MYTTLEQVHYTIIRNLIPSKARVELIKSYEIIKTIKSIRVSIKKKKLIHYYCKLGCISPAKLN